MSWETVNKTMSSNFFTLRNNGDSSLVRFVSEPVTIADSFQGQQVRRYAFALVNVDGLRIWTVGPRLLDVIRTGWEDFAGKLVNIVRVGERSSLSTRYDMTVIADQDATLIPNTFSATHIIEFVASAVTLEKCDEPQPETEIPF